MCEWQYCERHGIRYWLVKEEAGVQLQRQMGNTVAYALARLSDHDERIKYGIGPQCSTSGAISSYKCKRKNNRTLCGAWEQHIQGIAVDEDALSRF